MQPCDVLVVDDDAVLRGTMCDVLRQDGWAAHSAEHGAAALEFLKYNEARPSLIVLDVMMPVMSGYEFRQAQRNDPDLRDIPVIVLTAMRLTEFDAKMLDAPVLPKPLEMEQLLTEVSMRCRGRASV